MKRTMPPMCSVAFGSASGMPRPRSPVSWRYHSVASAASSALAPERGDHRGELRSVLAAGQGKSNSLQVAADRLQLSHDRARFEPALDELAETRERLRRVDVDPVRLEHLRRLLARLAQVARAA